MSKPGGAGSREALRPFHSQVQLLMQCPRCQTPMVEDVFEDLRDDTGRLHFSGWRCVCCGEILDPLIVKNRVNHPPPGQGRARQRPATRL